MNHTTDKELRQKILELIHLAVRTKFFNENRKNMEFLADDIESLLTEARIKILKELLEYRSYEIGEGAKPIVMPRGERRRLVDEFDIEGFINAEEAKLKGDTA